MFEVGQRVKIINGVLRGQMAVIVSHVRGVYFVQLAADFNPGLAALRETKIPINDRYAYRYLESELEIVYNGIERALEVIRSK